MTELKQKRYHMVLPEALYEEVKQVAKEHHTTTVEVIRNFLKLGLYATKVSDDENSTLLVREGDTEREILLFL